ncbi:MAG: GNAT family N-acetyltransferase [Candidatus Acidiferrales bacterium]
MVTIERRVGGLLRYRKVWFPSHEAVHEISQSLRPNDVVRFFGASADLGMFPSLVKHRQLRTAWVDLSAGPDGILQGMKKKSCRYEIRRAEKMLDRVEIELNSPKAHRDFLGVYNDFAKTKGLPRFPAAWLREYATHGETLVLYLNGEPLCCHFLLCDSQARIVRLLYSGSRRLQNPEDAAACGALNRYLHWHEMQRYHSRGFAIFDFGGIRHLEDNFSRFKLSFGGRCRN